jgi:hypothetical protein
MLAMIAVVVIVVIIVIHCLPVIMIFAIIVVSKLIAGSILSCLTVTIVVMLQLYWLLLVLALSQSLSSFRRVSACHCFLSVGWWYEGQRYSQDTGQVSVDSCGIQAEEYQS